MLQDKQTNEEVHKGSRLKMKNLLLLVTGGGWEVGGVFIFKAVWLKLIVIKYNLFLSKFFFFH